MYTTIFLSWYRLSLCKGHIANIQHLYIYRKNYTSASIKLNTKIPAYENFKMIGGNWGKLYAGEPKYLPHSCNPPTGKPVMVYSFVDENLINDLTMGRLYDGISNILNKTP